MAEFKALRDKDEPLEVGDLHWNLFAFKGMAILFLGSAFCLRSLLLYARSAAEPEVVRCSALAARDAKANPYVSLTSFYPNTDQVVSEGHGSGRRVWVPVSDDQANSAKVVAVLALDVRSPSDLNLAEHETFRGMLSKNGLRDDVLEALQEANPNASFEGVWVLDVGAEPESPFMMGIILGISLVMLPGMCFVGLGWGTNILALDPGPATAVGLVLASIGVGMLTALATLALRDVAILPTSFVGAMAIAAFLHVGILAAFLGLAVILRPRATGLISD